MFVYLKLFTNTYHTSRFHNNHRELYTYIFIRKRHVWISPGTIETRSWKRYRACRSDLPTDGRIDLTRPSGYRGSGQWRGRADLFCFFFSTSEYSRDGSAAPPGSYTIVVAEKSVVLLSVRNSRENNAQRRGRVTFYAAAISNSLVLSARRRRRRERFMPSKRAGIVIRPCPAITIKTNESAEPVSDDVWQPCTVIRWKYDGRTQD